jgi:hypothetical protein
MPELTLSPVLAANLASYRDGPCLVAPVVLVVPGVLNGSRGRLLYTAEDLTASANDWAGVPITRGHPVVGGKPVGAQALRSAWLGTLEEPRIDNHRLVARARFDHDHLKKTDPVLLARIENGEPLEVSTGLWIEIEDSPGEHAGQPYRGIARKWRPDHLAILTDQPGACSLRDGCGLNVNKRSSFMPDLTPERKAEIVQALVTNCACQDDVPWRGKDAQQLQALSDSELFLMNGWLAAATPAKPPPAPPQPPPTPPAPASEEEVLRQYPRLRQLVEHAAKREAEDKQQLIGQLLQNVEGDRRQSLAQQLATHSVDFLQSLTALVPRQPESRQPANNYFGQSGWLPPTTEEEPLTCPVIDWTKR